MGWLRLSGPRLGFAHGEPIAVDFFAIQGCDRSDGILGRAHLYEAESARTSSDAIGHDGDFVHSTTIAREQGSKRFFGRGRRDISDMEFRQNLTFLDSRASLRGSKGRA